MVRGTIGSSRALGMRRRDLVWLAVIRVGLITLAAAVVAVGVAIALSPLMPIGPARLAEPSPGVDVDVALLGIGLAVAALLPVLLVIPAVWRAAAGLSGSLPSDAKLHRPSYLATRLWGVGAPASSAIGVQMAFEPGRGRTAVPVQSTLIGSVIAVTAVTTALVFGANLNRLVTTPGQYGQNWQEEIDLGFGSVPAPVLDSAVAHQSGVRAYAYGDYGQITVGGRSVPAIAIYPRKGADFVTLLSGRVPAGPDEIAFGARTLHSLDRHIGDTVSVVVPGATHRVRIVGEAVFPSFSMGSFTPTDLGSGALVGTSLLASQAAAICSGSPPCYNFALTRFAPAANLPADSARLERAIVAAGCPVGYCNVVTDQRPTDIEDYTRVRLTPILLSLVLALFGLAMFTYVLVTSVQRRRRDLAVLKTLGFSRSQIFAVTTWQSNALAVVALLIGLPLGVVVGWRAWAVFADALGVSTSAGTPLLAVLVAIPVTLVLVNAAAAGPGWAASRVKPAAVLRSE